MEGHEERPGVVAARMILHNFSWDVTRQALMTHTLLPSVGVGPTIEECAKGRYTFSAILRTVLGTVVSTTDRKHPVRDIFGWDYFDFKACNASEVVYLHQPGQLEEL